MKRILITIGAALILAGCQSTPTRDPAPEPEIPPAIGTATAAPTGKDGVVVDHEPRVASEHRMRKILGIADSDPDIAITQHINNPTKKPTVKVKYSGKVKDGVVEDLRDVNRYRRKTVDGEVVTYYTDLGQMNLILERQVKGEPYDYRELSMVVPYGYCLDFIIENIGKTSKGYVLRSVECNQDNLGHDY